MRYRAAILVLLLGLTSALAAPPFDLLRDRYDIDAAHSSVAFSIGFMGVTTVEGRFARYNGTIIYDEADPAKSSVSVAIRTDSIFTASDFRDRHLKSADFFDAEKFPYITFRSTRVEKQPGGLLLHGSLTLHGITKDIAIPIVQQHGRVKDMWENTRFGFTGRIKLDRRDFGIVGPPVWERTLDAGRLTIGNEVEIILSIQGRVFNWERISGGPDSLDRRLLQTFEASGLDATLAQYRELTSGTSTPKPDDSAREGGLNNFATKLLYRGKTREALEFFKLYAEAFPQSDAAQQKLGDAHFQLGDRAVAAEHYRKALQLNPQNTTAMEMLRLLDSANRALQSAPQSPPPRRSLVPDTFTNLQVLPKAIAKADLMNVMRSFSKTLDQNCNFCHVATDDLTAADFPSDEKDNKKNARELLRFILKAQKPQASPVMPGV